MLAHQNYDYTWEVISLVAGIILTNLPELEIALLFGCREKMVLAFLAIVNIIMQVRLNVLLNIVNYNSGSMNFNFSYVLYEILVFVIEAVAHAVVLRRFSNMEQKKRVCLYCKRGIVCFSPLACPCEPRNF